MACANDETIINKVIMINPPNLVDLAKIPTKRSKFIKNILYSPILGTFIYNMYVNKKTIAHALCSSYYTQNEISEKIFSPTLKQHTKNIQIPNIFSPVKRRDIRMQMFFTV